MKEQTFEQFLMERHSAQYIGTDDDMTDDFEDWLSRLDVQEVMDYAERWCIQTKHAYAFNITSETLSKIK